MTLLPPRFLSFSYRHSLITTNITFTHGFCWKVMKLVSTKADLHSSYAELTIAGGSPPCTVRV